MTNRKFLMLLAALAAVLASSLVPVNIVTAAQKWNSNGKGLHRGIKPAVVFVTPSDAQSVDGSVAVTAVASDSAGVVGVQFKLDGANLGSEVTVAPYSVTWDTSAIGNGSHTLSAVARDAAGNSNAVAITVSVDNTVIDTEAPTVPAGLQVTATTSSQITFDWNAAADNVGVTGYQVYRDGVQVGTTATTSYSDSGLSDSTPYSYTVAAYDAAGNVSAQSSVLSATTDPLTTLDTTDPVVSFATPSNAQTLAGSVTLTANASDNVGVVGVQFKLDGANLGSEVTVAPYSVTWDTSTTGNGSHTLSAVARDAAGNSSAVAITVTVDNTVIDTEAPTVPTGLQVTATTSTQITFDWNAAADNVGVTGYQVYRDGVQVGTTPTTSYSDSGLSESTPYSYTVAAYDAAGNVSAQSSGLSATTSAASQSYTTNFDLDENPISEGGAWSNTGLDWTSVVTNNGIAYGTNHATGYNDSYAILSGFAPDQTAQAVISISGSFAYNQEVELLLRWTQSAHVAKGYEINWNANNYYAMIVRWNGALGDFTTLKRLSFPRPPVSGDVMKAQIVGNTITVYLNGNPVGSTTDSTYATGNPGMGFYSEDPSGAQNPRFGFTSYSATN